MAKIYGRCKLCDATKFLNGIGLCKRCNKSSESASIHKKAIAEEEMRIKDQKAQASHKDEEIHELEALKKLDDLTTEQKQRIEELEKDLGITAQKEDTEESLEQKTEKDVPKEEKKESPDKTSEEKKE